MSYYTGNLEHDTGIHADAEQAVTGTAMLMVSITLSEYRKMIEENSKSEYVIQKKEAEITECRQKLFDALNALDHCSSLTDTQKADFRDLCSDWRIKKG